MMTLLFKETMDKLCEKYPYIDNKNNNKLVYKNHIGFPNKKKYKTQFISTKKNESDDIKLCIAEDHRIKMFEQQRLEYNTVNDFNNLFSSTI